MRSTVRWGLGLLAALAVAWAVGCGMEASSKGGPVPDSSSGGGAGDWAPGGRDGGSGCASQADCIAGYTCQASVCVPPETEVDSSTSASPPVATPHYVYALNPTAASVARIDPRTLEIEAIPVGSDPVGLAALPGEDAAVVLSQTDGSLTVIDSSALPSRALRIPLKRQMARLTVSADGAFAVAWPSPAVAPLSGSEGIFILVDLKKARAGRPDAEVRFERGGGYRITDVLFRIEGGVATRLYVFAKSTVSSFDLGDIGTALPLRLSLPDAMAAAVTSREVVADDDARIVMLRSTVSAELASFDGAQLKVVPIPEIATDLDLLPDGSAAVAALRVSSKVAYVQIPQDLVDPTGIQTFDVTGASVGQVALPPQLPASGMFALVYSTVSDQEGFARIDLPSGAVTVHGLEKLIREVAVSPDGKSALVIHAPNPNSAAADPYERAVDQDEGYTVFDIQTGYWQLQRTGATRPSRYAFSPKGGHVGIALRNDALGRHSLHAVSLSSLVPLPLPLASRPLFMGSVPEAPGLTPHRVFVAQDHPAGRISVVQLDDGQIRTATGFTLNAEIE